MEALEAWVVEGIAGVASRQGLFVGRSLQRLGCGGSRPDICLWQLGKLDGFPLLWRLLDGLLGNIQWLVTTSGIQLSHYYPPFYLPLAILPASHGASQPAKSFPEKYPSKNKKANC